MGENFLKRTPIWPDKMNNCAEIEWLPGSKGKGEGLRLRKVGPFREPNQP